MQKVTQELVAHIESRNAKTLAWLAEDPSNRFAGLIVEDPAYWAEYEVFTVEDYEHYMARADLWDLYKEVNGVRPRHLDMKNMTIEEIEAEISYLQAKWEAEASMREEADEYYAELEAIEQENISIRLAEENGDFSSVNDEHRELYVTEQAPLGAMELVF